MKYFPEDMQTSIPMHERPELDDREDLITLIYMIDFAKTNRGLHEQLFQISKHGPVWDGDIISKVDRDALLKINACAKVIVKGNDGYNACTYFGNALLNIYNWMHGPLR